MRWWVTCTYVVLSALWARPAFGQLGALIYSQVPNRLFGFVSDSQFRDDFGQVQGSLYADRFSIQSGADIGQLVWYGHYGTQNQDFDPDPPTSENFRIRFYSQGVSPFPIQQLPAEVLYDASSDQFARQFNGAFVNGRREYKFVLTLPSLFSAQPGVPYWLEISQVGDVNSVFRWESSTGGERAFQFPLGSDWQLSTSGQMAYELRTPEPGSGVLVGLVGLILRRRGKCG